MNAPPGFVRLEIAAGFAADFGPIYARRDGERVWYGFRVEDKHLNPRGIAHGGALATFADMQLAALMRAGRLTPKQAPTISLSLDFLKPVPPGAWVQGEIDLVARSGRLAFSQCLLTVDATPVARASAKFAYSEKAASLDPSEPAPPRPAFVASPPPEGFEPFDFGPGFGAFFGPAFWRPGSTRFGFRVTPRHINLFGFCHGGALVTFADYQLGPLRRAGLAQGPFAPTLSLSMDFLGPARLGEWIEAEATLLRATSRYLFAQALLTNAKGAVARSNAIYAISSGETSAKA
ncbi:MAG: PaaI family thioesterase [Pseudomonadota bacterium]|nr:PaaI family thioesterase [Pseudomonadota bacterium]